MIKVCTRVSFDSKSGTTANRKPDVLFELIDWNTSEVPTWVRCSAFNDSIDRWDMIIIN